jgi:hypothetical protein
VLHLPIYWVESLAACCLLSCAVFWLVLSGMSSLWLLLQGQSEVGDEEGSTWVILPRRLLASGVWYELEKDLLGLSHSRPLLLCSAIDSWNL